MYHIGFQEHVVASGEKVLGPGLVEVYVVGAPLCTIPPKKNRGLNPPSCVAP